MQDGLVVPSWTSAGNMHVRDVMFRASCVSMNNQASTVRILIEWLEIRCSKQYDLQIWTLKVLNTDYTSQKRDGMILCILSTSLLLVFFG